MPLNTQYFIKRFIDIVASCVLLIYVLPLFLLLAIFVKLSSDGPILFVQERIGKNKKSYKVIKFRTMFGSPNKNAMRWTKFDESRITPIGHFLRDYGIDELPQLFNILKGDMSIIGPRPPLPEQVKLFTIEQLKMFKMRPGVLSLAAVEGRRSISMDKRYELHVKYVETWSLKLDLEILLKSIFVVLRRESATEKLS